MLTKEQAIALFGSRKALKDALGLKSVSSIAMWQDGAAVPDNHYLRIRYELKPEAFDADGALIESAKAA